MATTAVETPISPFTVNISFQGQTRSIEVISVSTSAQVYAQVLESCGLQEQDAAVKVLFKGKKLNPSDTLTCPFAKVKASTTKKAPQLLVMASSASVVQQVQDKRSDPTIRGFDQEAQKMQQTVAASNQSVWGSVSQQDKNYRFVKIQACNDQDFGHHQTTSTIPHAFAAQQLLTQMATDPGIVAIMRERQLVVNALREMDPIDDRLMQKKQHGGSAVLGYNTNRGLEIHVRLRAFDLTKGFLPYPQLIGTLIHELSHNWVSDHALLFWANFAQMRVEYLHTHARLAAQGTVVQGKSTAALAGVTAQCRQGMVGIAGVVIQELAAELPQYQLTPQPLIPAIELRCRELTQQHAGVEQGQRLGSAGSNQSQSNTVPLDPRQAALQAAEQRAREHQQANTNAKKEDPSR
eukprot:CAMPEP_0172447614 /NCGR_PEP_ID=MMETSP1065-20121228/6890_1 /TAXON_ID=265537 /ORGANISM="Amphiprora paludosa, Strain CCMP125" /LENGTH=406 /DNA_ID=CAMNT_0013198963 /DNA_START=83 /DNA_END=1303 /DNA_ORIENTATION=-